MSYWYGLACSTLRDAEIDAATAVLRSGRTTMGVKVEQFEEAFARKVGASHAVMTNSGSSADLLMAFAFARKGIVVVPAVTWPTHAWSWLTAGVPVRFVDVGEMNTTADRLSEAICDRTVAVSLVHLMGVPCDMGPILEVCDGLPITEDCCEALGASYDGKPVGSFGEAATYSFFFSHHMTTMEGGMVTTESAEVADRLRSLRSHGWARHLENPPEGTDPRYTFVDIGFNLRPTEISAAIGLVQLERLDEMNKTRAENLRTFAKVIEDNPWVSLPRVPHRGEASWFGIPLILHEDVDRDAFAKRLEEAGIETRPILAGNLLRQPALKALKHPLPNADRLHDHSLYIGLHPVPSPVEEVATLVERWAHP